MKRTGGAGKHAARTLTCASARRANISALLGLSLRTDLVWVRVSNFSQGEAVDGGIGLVRGGRGCGVVHYTSMCVSRPRAHDESASAVPRAPGAKSSQKREEGGRRGSRGGREEEQRRRKEGARRLQTAVELLPVARALRRHPWQLPVVLGDAAGGRVLAQLHGRGARSRPQPRAAEMRGCSGGDSDGEPLRAHTNAHMHACMRMATHLTQRPSAGRRRLLTGRGALVRIPDCMGNNGAPGLCCRRRLHADRLACQTASEACHTCLMQRISFYSICFLIHCS